MVAVRNSKKFEEFTRERIINYEGKYITSMASDIEIWNSEPIWDESVGAFISLVDDVNNDIELLATTSVEEFEKKYGMKLDYGEKVPVSGIIYD